MTMGNLGYSAEVRMPGRTRGSLGRSLYAAHWQGLTTSGGRQIMVAVISNKHWQGRVVTGIGERLVTIGAQFGVDQRRGGRPNPLRRCCK